MREKLLHGLPRETVHIDQIDGAVTLRALGAGESLSLYLKHKDAPDGKALQNETLAKMIVDENLCPVFENPAEIDFFDGPALRALLDAAKRLNGDDSEEMEGNSESDPSANSASHLRSA